MGRLIEANALLSEMEKYNDDTARSNNDYLFGMQQRLETCIELVEDAPTVDAVPVAYSEWIPKEKSDTPYGLEMECAKCGFSVIVNDALYFKFCPNCGARMDGDNDE